MSAPLQKSDPLTRPKLVVVEGREESLEDFDALFRRFAPYVATIGLRLLGADSELDDLIQDVFLEAHRGIQKLRDPHAIKGWLARITVRRATTRLRRRRLRMWFSLHQSSEPNDIADPSASPEKKAEVAGLYRALEKLAPDVRVAWVLRFVEGHGLDEIAELVNCSRSTVQRRVRTAQAQLNRGVLHD
jgi:RNA polymerase sigma-70 factor (ECF subfamily)